MYPRIPIHEMIRGTIRHAKRLIQRRRLPNPRKSIATSKLSISMALSAVKSPSSPSPILITERAAIAPIASNTHSKRRNAIYPIATASARFLRRGYMSTPMSMTARLLVSSSIHPSANFLASISHAILSSMLLPNM